MSRRYLTPLLVLFLDNTIPTVVDAFSSKDISCHIQKPFLQETTNKAINLRPFAALFAEKGGGGLPSFLQPPIDSQEEFRLFLTQCSIQSFMFLLRQTKDPYTIRWLEGFTKPNIRRSIADQMADEANYQTGKFVPETNPNNEEEGATETSQSQTFFKIKLLQYHGLGAMNVTLFPTWETYFRDMLRQPKEFYLIESSKSHIPSYELDVDPASICSRILSVREQISREFTYDLGVIAGMGESALKSYWENLRRLRHTLDDDDDDDDDNNDNGNRDELDENYENVGIERENLLFLEWSPDPENSDYMPSPLRKGNFDLLTLLTTKESILRVLEDETRVDGAERAANEFLRSFLTERARYFTGSQRYGRADTILEDLIKSPPRMVQVREDVTSLVDPMRIAELVVAEREKVAREWQQIASDSPKEHMEVRRMQLNRMMGIDN